MKHTENDNFPGGVLVINKPEGKTSHDIVNSVRRLYNTKRMGHAGTLDPLATGVLCVLVGRAAKACEYISSDKKRYVATLRLGLRTDTEDITGKVLEQNDKIPGGDEVAAACEKFVGKIMQTPPMYSALKVDGKKLYDLARQGVTVERQAREIEIFSLKCQPVNNSSSDYILDVECGGGTYIRTLCADIGDALGCGGVMASLHRIEACGMSIGEAHTIEEIEDMDGEERIKILLPTERLFYGYAAVCLPRFFEKLFRDGCPIYQKKIKTSFEVGQRIRICDEGGKFFALGEVVEREEGSAIKSIKLFEI